MDIVKKRGVVDGQGNAAGDYSDFVQRSGSWQYGADAHSNDIENEGQEEDLKFGVVHGDMDFDPPTDRYTDSTMFGSDGYIYDTYTGNYTPAKIDTKPPTPTYRHAQKEAMQRGDARTYFMQKTAKAKGK